MVNSDKNVDYKKYFRRALIFIIIISIFSLVRECKHIIQQKQDKLLYENLNDTLTKWVDKDGKNRAKIDILTADNIAVFTMLDNQSVEIQRLQKVIEKHKKNIKPGSSGTIISTTGGVSINVPTVIIPNDTINNDFYPIYKSSFDKEGWVWGNVVATKDSTSITFKYRDDFDIVLGEEPQGFLGLGKSKPFADITSHNPYTEIQTFRTFKVKSKPVKKIGIGPGVYYGVGTGFVPQVFVGIGIQLNLIRL